MQKITEIIYYHPFFNFPHLKWGIFVLCRYLYSMKIIINESQLNYLLEIAKQKSTDKKEVEVDVELDEQDADTGSADTGAGGASATPTSTTSANAGVSKGYPKVTKWDERPNATKRGKANPLGKSGEKWQSGLVRGVANNLF